MAKKLSHEQFFAGLRESAGIYSRAVRLFKKEFGVTITRQGVKQRADLHPDEMADIIEQNIDIAEDGLHSLMRHKDPKIKMRACTYYLDRKAKARGYSEKLDVSFDKLPKIEIEYINRPKKD